MQTTGDLRAAQRSDSLPAMDFHGASVINEQGEEIPITENMIQAACNMYIQQWEVAQKKRFCD